MFDYNKNFIKVIPNFINKEDIDFFLEFMDNNMKETETQREIIFLDRIGNKEVADKIAEYEKKAYSYIIGEYLPEQNLRFEKLVWMRRLELVRWNHGSGLDAHRDGHDGAPLEPHMSLSSLIYLNDDYIGGEVVFEEFGIVVKPRPGDFIVFPSHFLHQVTQSHKINNGRLRCTIPFFYGLEARRFNEYTQDHYLAQIEEYNQGKGEYFSN